MERHTHRQKCSIHLQQMGVSQAEARNPQFHYSLLPGWQRSQHPSPSLLPARVAAAGSWTGSTSRLPSRHSDMEYGLHKLT